MEIEQLTKSQIILLVLLVSFVTSIATGIVTVSLLAQTPPAITQTINRVVERTVETVVPSENQSASVVTKETTVVVKEEDLITESIAQGFSRIARVHEGIATSSPIIALASVTGNGTVVTDLSRVSGTHAVQIGDKSYEYVVSKKIPELGIAFMAATGTAPTAPAFKGVGVDSVKLGHTMIGLYGARSDRVAMSVVSAISEADTITVGEEDVTVRFVETTITETVTPGAPVLSIFGDLVGVSTHVSRTDGAGSFISFGDVTNLVAAQAEKEKTEESKEEEGS